MHEPPTGPERDRVRHDPLRQRDPRDSRRDPVHDDARRPGLEALITSISTELTILDAERLDAAVGQALQRVGEAVEVDHAWLCRTTGDGTALRLVHEWCTYGMSAFDALDGVPVADDAWLQERLRSQGTVSIASVAELPAAAAPTAGLLRTLELESLLAVPLASGSRLRGYAAFATRGRSIACSPDDLALLRFVGDILADALERIEEEARRTTAGPAVPAEPAGTVELLRAQREILEKIAAGTDRDGVLAGLAGLADRNVPHMRSSIWSLDPLGESLRCVGGDLPTALKAAIQELEPGLDVGPFGLSCAGERVVVDDVMRDPGFQSYHHEALAGGVRSCWTEPVQTAAGRVVGLVALAGGSAATPSPGEQELVRDVARMTGLAFERFGDAPAPDADTPVRPEEERLAALVRRARNMQSLGREAAAVVRDFNNAFTAILGNAEILLDGVATVEDRTRAERSGSETVLVCETDDMVRELATTVLETHGYTVLSAPDGTAALQAAETHRGRIHLVVTDALTRGRDGRELTQQLSRRCPGIRALYTSGYPADAFDRLARGPRAADVLEKPFSTGDLLARVRRALDAADGI